VYRTISNYLQVQYCTLLKPDNDIRKVQYIRILHIITNANAKSKEQYNSEIFLSSKFLQNIEADETITRLGAVGSRPTRNQ